MDLRFSAHFQRQFKKLSPGIKVSYREKEKLFTENPFHSQLKTHKLSGKLNSCWAFGVSNSIRVIFHFAEGDTVWMLEIGNRDIYE